MSSRFTKGFENLHQPSHGAKAQPQSTLNVQRLGKKGKGMLSANEMKSLRVTLEKAASYNHEVKNTRVLQGGSGRGGGMNVAAGTYREIVAPKGYQMPAPIQCTQKRKSASKIKEDVERLDRVEPMGVPTSRYISEACKQELQNAYIKDPRTVSTVPRHTRVKEEWGLMQPHGVRNKDQRINKYCSGEAGISGTAGKKNFPQAQPSSVLIG